ncbi:MAG: hypothetical protein IT440_03620, partial [Phycisphaeraceae bacterium]|nr:hypothetical protein [Phycisphaeraceae bacterium]
MLIGVLLLMFVGGIALAQAVCDPKEVTLRWLRLGGLIALALLAFSGMAMYLACERMDKVVLILSTAIPAAAQLMLTQLGHRRSQRMAAGATWVWACAVLAVVGMGADATWLARGLSAPAAGGLLGACLMTMLLGHAYLTAGGEMTQKPFLRLVVLLAV